MNEIKMKSSYYKAIIDNSPDSIVLIGIDHKVLAFNKTIKEVLFNYHHKELSVGDLYYPDFVVDSNKALYLKAFNTAIKGETYVVKNLTSNDNVSLWFEYKMQPVYENEILIGVVLRAKNITIEKEAEREIAELSKKLKAILNNTDEAITLLDTNYKILAMNKISESFLKINTNLDIDIGNDFRNYIPDKNNLFYRYFLKSIEGESNTVEIPYQNLYRPTIWHETKFNPVYTEDKQLIGVSIFAKDITDKKNIELSLKESEDRFQVIVEKNIAGIFILQNNILIYTNPVFAKTFGFDSKSKVPITLFESFIYKDDLNIFYDLINSEDKNLEPKQTVIRILNPIGKLLYFELMLTSISFNAEQAYVGMMIDVTERTGQETRINEAIILAQENERLQIGMELHDNIKQIISGISMYLDIGLKKLDDKESLKKILLDLKKHNDLASIELRRLSHELAPMLDESSNFTDKIEWLIESLKLRENITVVVKIDEYKQPISNKIQLAFYRILQEQLGNIMRYSKAKKISITLKKFKNKIYFKIKDNGIGFDMQSIKMGIGLENIKRRAKILNGTSKINTMLGKGCEIIISVPNIEN